jgi:hypothetical protein
VCPVEARDLTSVELAKEFVLGGGQKIDQLAVESFFFSERLGFRYSGFRQRWISAAFIGNAAKEGGGIVGDFSSQRLTKASCPFERSAPMSISTLLNQRTKPPDGSYLA